MKKIILTFVGILLSLFLMAQNEFDALRFSQVYYYGTARSMSMGNAFTALGADPGAVAYNPAALAMMRKSDFSMTPGFKIAQASATFNGNTQNDIRYKFTLNNLSLTFVTSPRNGMVKHLNFGITYNRIRDFNQRLWIEGVNTKGSMLDDFMYRADGYNPEDLNPFNTYLAYWSYLIDLADSNSLTYTNPLWITGGPYYGETQRKIVKTSGNGSSLDFSAGMDIGDFLYMGLSIASINMSYSSLSEYTEFNFNQAVDLKDFKFNENLKDEVNGVAVKLGVIFTPIKSLRLGIAAQTPYFLRVKDVYYSSIESNWFTPDSSGNTSYLEESPVNTYLYSITTPWRLSMGMGVIVGKILALGADYELVDYSTIRMDANDYDFVNENTNIQKNFKSAHNIRMGADLNLKGFHIRGGYSYYGSAFGRIKPVSVFSGGLGYRTAGFYIDLGVQQSISGEEYWLYVPYEDEPMPQVAYRNMMVSLTIGTHF